jgi:hypothetical protein
MDTYAIYKLIKDHLKDISPVFWFKRQRKTLVTETDTENNQMTNSSSRKTASSS